MIVARRSCILRVVERKGTRMHLMKNVVRITLLWLAVITTAHAQLTPEMEGSKIMRRFTDYNNRRIPNGVVVPDNARSAAIDQLRRMERSKLSEAVMADQPTWTVFGPNSTAGRIKSIIIHPETPEVVYVAAAAGGVWKTTNGGESWRALFDDGNAIAMGSLCFEPGKPQVIYAGTGEQVTNSTIYLGAGLFRSEDGGETWTTVGLTNVGSFSRIYAHPKNPNLLMAACMNTNSGVYRSTDRGQTWERLYTGNVYDMSINPSDENEWFIAVQNDGILYTNDGGRTWTPRMRGLIGTVGRISVQQSPRDPNVLHCLAELNSLATIARSTDRGLTWEARYSDSRGCFFAGACNPSSSQGFYDNYAAVSPHDVNVAFVGGIDIWRTTNGGTSWANMTAGYADGNGANLVHVDQHCLAFHPTDPKIIYAGNDGGMHKSTDGGSTWFQINNGLQVTQFYSFDVDPTRRERAYGGTQDNGTLGTFGNIEWDTVAGGDGMVTIVNWADPDVIYGNYPNGQPWRVNLRTNQGGVITNGLDPTESALWVAPMVISPGDEFTLYHGRQRVWRTFDGGEFWFESSPPFVNQVSALAVSPADPGVVWAGSSSGELMVSADDANTWATLPRTELSNNFISDIHCSRKDWKKAWISFSTYGTKNLWVTTDLGLSWTPLWENMPNVPVNAIESHPDDENILFVATDVGVFASFDAGKQWMPYGKGLPRSPVLDIKLNTEFEYLRVVTHGRSAWEAPLVSVAPTEPVITRPTGGDIFIGTLPTAVSWAGFTPPVRVEYSVDDGQTWSLLAEDVVSTALLWTVPNWPTVVGRIRITSQTNTTEQVVSRTFTIQTMRRGGLIEQTAVPWVPYGLATDGRGGLWSTSFYSNKMYKLNATTYAVEKILTLPSFVGDSLFTDLTMDRANGILYLHRMNDSQGTGGSVIAIDTNGQVINTFASQARRYPTGLEYVNGTLVAGERDGFQKLYTMDLSGGLISEVDNPYKQNFGPRCLAWDDQSRMFQTSTTFPTSGGALTACYIIQMGLDNLSVETDRLELIGPTGLINARGIEYDRADKNFWVSDFGGNIYKIAGFDFVPPPVTSVDEELPGSGAISAHPNPASTSVLLTIDQTGTDRHLDVSIIDLYGRTVATVYSGTHTGSNAFVKRVSVDDLPSGTYRVVAVANGAVVSSTMLIVTH